MKFLSIITFTLATSTFTIAGEYGDPVGKKFWFSLDQCSFIFDKPTSNIRIIKDSPIEGEFVRKFTTDKTGDAKYLQINFSDGTIGFIRDFVVEIELKDTDISKHPHCIYSIEPHELKRKNDEIERFKKEIEDSSNKFKQELQSKPNAKVGMTKDKVIFNSNWGFPDKKNKSTTAKGVVEQWIYKDRGYLYFFNGNLYEIQE